MSPEELTRAHYTQIDLMARLLDALRTAGYEIDSLEADSLAGAEEFHLGGRAATRTLIGSMNLDEQAHVLDVGCGIGGPARTIARISGCRVTGIDITETFVETANHLSRLMGLADRTRFSLANSAQLPFHDDDFDAVSMIHVGMNIADKPQTFTELARVVRPQGKVAVYDIMRIADGELTYPLPWAAEPTMSFLETPTVYEQALRNAGLTICSRTDRTDLALEVIQQLRKTPPKVHLGHLMGAEWPTMFGNLVDAVQKKWVAPMEIIALRA